MLRAVSFFVLVGCTFAATLHLSDTALNGRIVNGEDTIIQHHPYQVSVQVKSLRSTYEHICGGSMIREDFAVTAGHCVANWNPPDLAVYLGSSYNNAGGQRIEILQAMVHEKFNDWTMENDVALLKLSKKVKKSANTGFIPLCEVTPTSNAPAVVSGWGDTCFGYCPSPVVLQKAEVKVISRFYCNTFPYQYYGEIREGMICAGGNRRDSCQGDSGGPLVSEGKLIGITSWGVGCAIAAFPGVYSDVAYFRNWILKTMEKK